VTACFIGPTCNALKQPGDREDALAEDGLDTDAEQRAEVGERQQHSGRSEKYRRRLPRIWKSVIRHVKPADESPALATGVRGRPTPRQRAQNVGNFRSVLPRTLVEEADRDGTDAVGSVGGRQEVGSADGRRD